MSGAGIGHLALRGHFRAAEPRRHDAHPGNPGGTKLGFDGLRPRLAHRLPCRGPWPTIVKLIPRREFNSTERRGTLDGASAQHTEQDGTPYGMARTDLAHNHCPASRAPGRHSRRSTWMPARSCGNVQSARRPGSTSASAPRNGDTSATAVRWSRRTVSCSWRRPTTTRCGLTTVPVAASYGPGNCPPVRIRRPWDTGTVAWTTPRVTAGGDLTEGGGRGDYLIAFGLATDTPPDVDENAGTRTD